MKMFIVVLVTLSSACAVPLEGPVQPAYAPAYICLYNSGPEANYKAASVKKNCKAYASKVNSNIKNFYRTHNKL